LRVAGEIPSEILRRRIAESAPELEETMATVEEQLIQKGVRQGVEQGLRQGVEQGLRQGVEQGLRQGVEQGLRQGVEQGLRQGVEQGLRQGVEQGRSLALRETLTRLLRARFGDVDATIQARIAAASPAALDRWLERVLTAEQAADIFDR
jgi:flagellar biosynthesis/type III secretory pathway protein FliH